MSAPCFSASSADSAESVELAEKLSAVDWAARWCAPFAERGRHWQATLQAPVREVSKSHGISRASEISTASDIAGVLDTPESAEACDDDWRGALNSDARMLQLTTSACKPLRFVAQSALPAQVAYEAHIAATGAVPTRANLHDIFNALAWCTFARLKAQLNAAQASEIERHGIGAARGGIRDALTLFDENAMLFACADPSLGEALRAFDWRTLFETRRADWGRQVESVAFGHALLEKLVHPYKAITAHAWIVRVPPAYFEWPRAQRLAYLDEHVAAELNVLLRSPRDLTPLPVLGVPGWWAPNAEPGFYADRTVFRPHRDIARAAR
ncbi:DUF3025 domain-containing protein [Burkholderia sp. L27(2015)]|uniref:DUF3025 domain-containing protein n=1 Tax=Burkholderia sp. L27(2015) TaxID=1641858 RepID=UPI00131CA8E2|nr:DUF3025 domain-containing protein [Burkholderia sp. L27(2015)]